MRIVHIITRLIVGGAQENTLLSCEGQHDRGHDVTLITGPAIGPEGSLLERAKQKGYRVEIVDSMRRAIHPSRDFQTYRSLVSLLRQIQPQVVHTHSSKAGILGRWAARRANRAIVRRGGRAAHIVHTIHGLAFTASTRRSVNYAYKKLEQAAAPITDAIVCVADEMARQSLAARIGRPAQYVTVYSGMETGPYLRAVERRDPIRAELGIEAGQVVVTTIARLFDLKGHCDILAMAPRLCAQFPDLRFLWVGDGSLRADLERQMEQIGLRSRFILTGLVPPERIASLAAATDILLHPSRREGLARAIVQGQLGGAPALCYDVDGNREGLIPGETGFAVEPFNVHQLEQKIQCLAGDPVLRHKMGQAGRAFALARFDAQAMVDSLEKVYASL